MLNSVSGVSFGSRYSAMDKVSPEQLNSYGTYSMPDMAPAHSPKKKKGGFLGFLGKLILTAAVVGGALVGARKFLPAVKNASTELAEGAKLTFGKKLSYYTAKSGDAVEKAVVGGYNAIKGWFTKAKPEAAPEVKPQA